MENRLNSRYFVRTDDHENINVDTTRLGKPKVLSLIIYEGIKTTN